LGIGSLPLDRDLPPISTAIEGDHHTHHSETRGCSTQVV
jgi:hypothetical protein